MNPEISHALILLDIYIIQSRIILKYLTLFCLHCLIVTVEAEETVVTEEPPAVALGTPSRKVLFSCGGAAPSGRWGGSQHMQRQGRCKEC